MVNLKEILFAEILNVLDLKKEIVIELSPEFYHDGEYWGTKLILKGKPKTGQRYFTRQPWI